MSRRVFVLVAHVPTETFCHVFLLTGWMLRKFRCVHVIGSESSPSKARFERHGEISFDGEK